VFDPSLLKKISYVLGEMVEEIRVKQNFVMSLTEIKPLPIN
jgi:hypothetical protein